MQLAKEGNQMRYHLLFLLWFSDLSFVPHAVDVDISIVSANVWFTSPNIEAQYENDHMYLFFDDGAGNTGEYDLTIPKGLYSVTQLNNTIQILMSHEIIPGTESTRFPCNCITIQGDLATQRVNISFLEGLGIRTETSPTYPSNVAPSLGYTQSATLGPATFSGQTYPADDVARLNRISSFLLHGDIVKKGIQVNDRQSFVLAEIQLDVQPGKLLTYRPFLPFKIDGRHLVEADRDSVTFWLTDEKDRPIDTNGEDWSFALLISYTISTNHVMTQGRNPAILSSTHS